MPEALQWILEHEESFRESRLRSLFSDLSLQRQTNTSGYAANVSAWTSALSSAALAGQLPSSVTPPSTLTVQTSDALLNGLSSQKHGRPLGLGTVIDEAVRTGKFITVDDFLAAPKNIYSKSWVPSPWSLLSWGLKTIGFGEQGWGLKGRLRVGNLVIVQNLEKTAELVLSRQEKKGQSLTDRVISREDFNTELGLRPGHEITPLPSELDVKILLRYLHREKTAISYNGKVIKFKSPSSTNPEPITQQDETIATLKSLISSLAIQCSNLSIRVNTCKETAAAAVKTSTRTAALSALRSKKLAERTLETRSATLLQLEEVFSHIQQAADQVEIVNVMKASAGVIRGLNQKVGDISKVEDVVEELREEMAKVDEVGQVVAEPLGSAEQIDETEIDDELELMEKALREAEAEKQQARQEREAEVTRQKLSEVAVAVAEHDPQTTDLARRAEILGQRLDGTLPYTCTSSLIAADPDDEFVVDHAAWSEMSLVRQYELQRKRNEEVLRGLAKAKREENERTLWEEREEEDLGF